MAINTIKATIQMRTGMEDDFDPSQMTAGEWAVSKDTKYVRMCFMPGLCLRIATYEAFEEDMKRIQQMLSECQDIKKAVQEFVRLAEEHKTNAEYYSMLSKSWAVGDTGVREGENTNNAMYYSKQSESFAHGGTGTRIGEDVDNSEYYSKLAEKLVEEAKRIVSAATRGALIPAGTIRFEELPTEPIIGYMYNISNDFITDDRFEDGAGVYYSAGNNVYWNVYEKWDVLTGLQEYDFVGTKAELDAMIESGEYTENMTVYLLDGESGGGESGGSGADTGNLQEQINKIKESIPIKVSELTNDVPYMNGSNYVPNDIGRSGYVIYATKGKAKSWAQRRNIVDSIDGHPEWIYDWRYYSGEKTQYSRYIVEANKDYYANIDINGMFILLEFFTQAEGGGRHAHDGVYLKLIPMEWIFGQIGNPWTEYTTTRRTKWINEKFEIKGNSGAIMSAEVDYYFQRIESGYKIHFGAVTLTKSSNYSNYVLSLDTYAIGSNQYAAIYD